MKAKTVALIAGFGFIFLALTIQGILPSLMKESQVAFVTKTVRTTLGELKTIKGEVDDYPELLMKGRRIYIREGCWYCHSMYVRPVAGEEMRWGPLSEVGEYAFDIPHTFGTRRIGPDLTRVGGKYGDDWHVAHFFNPRIVVPDSIMPKFPWLFEKTDDTYSLNKEGTALTAFVQNIGMNRGKWRDRFSNQIATSGSSGIKTIDSVNRGRAVYERRCAGCHGEQGDGKGPAAAFFQQVKPRDFTAGTYKFRTTPSGSLPLDADLYRTITVGLRGTAMPPWYDIPEGERWDVIHFIKTFSEDFEAYPPDPPIYIPAAPESTMALIARGKDLFETFQCWQCHGKEGKGDGPVASSLTDDWGDKILPTNFTPGIFKGGPRPEDVYRTVMSGLNGTPMPSYYEILAVEEDRWALAYYILSLSADGD